MEQLFRYNYRPLCLYALHYIQDPDKVEDVVQECFAALWEKQQAGTVVSNPRAYLYMAVRNRCLDHLRKAGLKTLSDHYHVSFVCTDLSKQLSGEFDIDNLDLIITLIESALDVNIMKISSIPVRNTR